MTEPYTIDICPVCRQQIPDTDGLAAQCFHEEYGYVDGVNVVVKLANPKGVEADIKALMPKIEKAGAAYRKRRKAERRADELREEADRLMRGLG